MARQVTFSGDQLVDESGTVLGTLTPPAGNVVPAAPLDTNAEPHALRWGVGPPDPEAGVTGELYLDVETGDLWRAS